MSNTAALLGTYLCTRADINYYTQQSIYWNNLYEANLVKLNKQVRYEEQWNKAYDDGMAAERDLKIDGQVIIEKDNCNNECLAIEYADAKVEEYDEDLLLELTDKDMEYDTMKTMYDTLLEELRAKEEAEKPAVSDAAQDTGFLK